MSEYRWTERPSRPPGSRLSACPACDRIHVAADVVFANKFGNNPSLYPYRAADGSFHATRELAQEWLCSERQKRQAAALSP